MTNLQFRVLYQQLLFRMVDLELLSAHARGDITKLFGQIAALLILISLVLSLPAMGVSQSRSTSSNGATPCLGYGAHGYCYHNAGGGSVCRT